jgi:hypothetical protein
MFSVNDRLAENRAAAAHFSSHLVGLSPCGHGFPSRTTNQGADLCLLVAIITLNVVLEIFSVKLSNFQGYRAGHSAHEHCHGCLRFTGNQTCAQRPDHSLTLFLAHFPQS